jgi:hypothetical protein
MLDGFSEDFELIGLQFLVSIYLFSDEKTRKENEVIYFFRKNQISNCDALVRAF